MKVAEFIADYIAANRVHYIFGYPGAAILPMMDAINKHPTLKWILMRNELSASFAASAQGKLTDQISVCMASSGPGATNLLTGLLDADLDRSPVLAITGLVPTIKHGLSHFQDVDQIEILKSSCGFSARCQHPMQVVELLQCAIGYVIKNKRTAHFAIPYDIQLVEFTNSQLKSVKQHFINFHYSIELMKPPIDAIDLVAKQISEYEDIIIAVGPRARFAGKEIEILSEKLKAPIICSFASKGVINESHPNYFGVLGLFGAPANQLAMHAIKHAKLVITFGVDDLVYFLTAGKISQQRDFIQCEPTISSVNYQFIQKRILLGRLSEIALELANRVNPRSSFLKKTIFYVVN